MVADNSGSTHVVLHGEERNDLTDHLHAVDEFLSLHADDLTHNEHRAFKTLRTRVDHERCALNAAGLATTTDFALGVDLAARLIVAHVATAKCAGQRGARDVFDLHDEIATEMVVHANATCDASEDLFGQMCAVAEMVGVSVAEVDR
ncbi:hypothetical protein JK354_19380 [Haloferax volcanii]|uniref:Uncharacterized protein n=2 Tax=Haloferax volcanii TaxID=2246 RepID=D4H0G7_HALVD|nr:hypothetical protein [Haloferax volcanii]ADE05221.1 uncharacterized protein HVO_C0087 [Haloferax volcanii DS2]MBS8121299.1 hypothetical protein [Haloferax volcanii]MBS8126307.1 hypothetical protein [Haloferax volcanii]MBS8130177.1 hypothetical protein [Haloferax volcanii]MBS8134055.1 hypothetical protein [Haloferax volcanii]